MAISILEGVPTAIKMASDPLIDFLDWFQKQPFRRYIFLQVHQGRVQN